MIYLGLAQGYLTFVFSGFVKSIPVEWRKRMMDGLRTIRTFFKIVFPFYYPPPFGRYTQNHVDMERSCGRTVAGYRPQTITIAIHF